MDAKDVHKFDQAIADIRNHVCPMLFSYYSGFLDVGFNKEQAMRLTLNYQMIILTGKSKENDEKSD